MKKILIALFLALTLSSCALDSLSPPPKFDSNEYSAFVKFEIYTEVVKADCDSSDRVRGDFKTLLMESLYLKQYTKYLPNNKESAEIAEIIFRDVVEMVKRYEREEDPSKAYCEGKMTLLQDAITRALRAEASKVR